MGYHPRFFPSKEKERLYEFMERHKKQGVVSGRKVDEYMSERGLGVVKEAKISKAEGGLAGTQYGIYNKRETRIGHLRVNKSQKVNAWSIY